jgi:hypothetical protein
MLSKRNSGYRPFSSTKTSYRNFTRNLNQIPLTSYRIGNEEIEKAKKKFKPEVLNNGVLLKKITS